MCGFNDRRDVVTISLRRSGPRFGLAALGALAAISMASAPLTAQQAQPQQAQQRPAEPKQAQPKPSGGGDRVARIEEQLVDLQVALGSLESMVRSNGGLSQAAAQPAPSSFDSGGGGDDGRVMALETQIQALTSQLEQVTAQMAALEQRLGGGGSGMVAPMPRNDAPPAQYLPNSYDAPPAALPPGQGGGDGQGRQAGFDHGVSFGEVGAAGPQPMAAGAAGDPIGGLIGGDPTGGLPDPAGSSATSGQPPRNLAALAPDAGRAADPSGASPKEIYDAAYRQLMAREFDSAESAFRLFVSSFPRDPLAGEAQYWLGETHYVRGQHKQAADAFLSAYRGYGESRKAPDSLLKLALSLQQLEQKDAACSALSAFGEKYPQAAAHLKERAAAERRRAGC
jgi:tol-pal system protein YbgF